MGPVDLTILLRLSLLIVSIYFLMSKRARHLQGQRGV